ncbi:PaaI family thioesterase [Bacillus dakarensis]|uniref:PaaI family thioesterase n=1 Tax=Robertmurraya dakarensis TaxID=1926278 RepID=UPI000981D511|nr:PaaI family thioesterase [Bacillus dakarensis]
MNEKLTEKFHQFLLDATEEETIILEHVLDGVKQKRVSKQSTINAFLQMKREFHDNSCEITIPLTQISNNNKNILHGGVTAAIMDETMGSLAHSLLPEGYSVVTTQLNINYLAPGVGDYVTCQSRMEHKGAKTMVLSADVFRSDGQKIAHATGSFFVINSSTYIQN